jgi:hypothetical protein
MPRRPETLLLVDCTTLNGRAEVAEMAFKASTVVNIDHHISNTGLRLQPGLAAGLGNREIIFDLLKALQ